MYTWHIHAHASTEECEDAEKEKDESMNTGDDFNIIQSMWRPPSPCRIRWCVVLIRRGTARGSVQADCRIQQQISACALAALLCTRVDHTHVVDGGRQSRVVPQLTPTTRSEYCQCFCQEVIPLQPPSFFPFPILRSKSSPEKSWWFIF